MGGNWKGTSTLGSLSLPPSTRGDNGSPVEPAPMQKGEAFLSLDKCSLLLGRGALLNGEGEAFFSGNGGGAINARRVVRSQRQEESDKELSARHPREPRELIGALAHTRPQLSAPPILLWPNVLPIAERLGESERGLRADGVR